MILILGKDDICEYIENLRNRIRKEQNFQTRDEISKENFIRLYNLYGTDLEERVFARYVLDISYNTYSRLITRGIQNHANIFTREKYSDEYIENLRKQVLSQNNLYLKQEIDYNEFIRIYNSCEHKLDIEAFAFKVLEMSYKNLIRVKKNNNKKCKIFSRTKFSNTQILELRRILKENENIDSGTQINYEKVLELHKKYAKILSVDSFAQNVLEISRERVHIFKKESKKLFTILYKEDLKPEEKIIGIRYEVAKQYSLHVDDEISYELFLKIYEQYKNDFTEKRFACDILGISYLNLNYIKKHNSKKTVIFEKEKLQSEEITELRNRLIKEEKLHSQDEVNYNKFKELYDKYSSILSELQFSRYILGMRSYGFR